MPYASAESLSRPSDRDRLIPEPGALGPVQWGILAFLLSEVAFFSTLIVAYISFLHAGDTGPTPRVLSLPLVFGTTFCLIASSFTIHQAERRLRADSQAAFLVWLLATMMLGILFLAGTGYEWHHLIFVDKLTISRNLFGTTFYTLVGFHALHVTGGVVAMFILLVLGLRGRVSAANHISAQMVGWYWHFVDGVWIVVFTVVYLIGR